MSDNQEDILQSFIPSYRDQQRYYTLCLLLQLQLPTTITTTTTTTNNKESTSLSVCEQKIWNRFRNTKKGSYCDPVCW
ncbi:hypothetical protein LOAG_00333 [Loa loa]|uniref:Uncharacterized protein n=1 Tax=Loa loa TaxID=7209 RepID=A0A1S0UBF9_LOALO|nr:hypothetical protein LOAG_00333 [Loa loa]EFO28153.2 hypothetical protein LOAG_00333 [Loa loa]